MSDNKQFSNNNNNNNNNNNDNLNTKQTNHNNIHPQFTKLLKTDIQNINNPIYSEHNMINISDILYFFSKDIDKERLINVFSNKKTTIHTTKTNNALLRLVNYIDKTKRSESVPERKSDNSKINSPLEFRKYIKDIEQEYTIKSGSKNNYAGWNYYDENKDFINKFFKEDSPQKEKSTEQKIPIIPLEVTFSNDKENTPETNCTQLIQYPTSNIKTYIIPQEDICQEHEPPSLKKEEYTYIYINVEITCIKDLLQLQQDYPLRDNIKYNINIKAIHNIAPSLRKLHDMIGLSILKESIVDQIIYYIQDFHKLGNNTKDFMHTVIYGPPGTGKTEIAKIIGDIFSKLGILKNNIFKKVTRADLIAGYLGQTAIKTKNVISDCLGGVLFIDEAYALGNNEKGDSFSKECIDTLCEALSHHKDDIMVIIAGYEEELKNCFFNYNEGLESRFVWRFSTQKYTPRELRDIFIKKVKDAGWKTRNDLSVEWFEKNYGFFKSQGRDVETLFAKTKIAHSRRVFCKPIHYKTVINEKDIEGGLRLYKKNEDRPIKDNNYKHMYV